MITVDADFSFVEERSSYYLVPNYSGKCFEKGKKYPYNYYRGELQGQIPIRYYTKSHGAHSNDTIDFLHLDTTLTVYYLGSVTNIFYTVRTHPGSPNIELTIFDFKGQKCETQLFDKTSILYLIEEREIQSGMPPYDTYSRIKLLKRKQ